MRSDHSPQDAIDIALRAARCDDCIVIADESSTANLRWAGNTLTTNGVSRTRQLTVIAISRGGDGTKVGVVSRAGVRDEQIADVVAEASEAAAEGSPAEDAQPLAASAPPLPASAPGWDDPPAATEIGVFSGFAAELGNAFASAASADRLLYGYAEHQMTSTFLGTSTGLRLRHDQPTGRLELNAKSADLARSSWTGVSTRDFRDVDVLALETELAQQLGWASRSVELPAGRYETLLPPSAVSDLMAYMYWSAGARDAIDGRTVFSKPGGTRVGERLSSTPLTMFSDPATPGLQCAPFVIAHASHRISSVFDNGQPSPRTEWISGGTLGALIQTRYSAQLSGLPYTPWVDNLTMQADGSSASLTEMIAGTTRGLLLTCLWYVRDVDPQTLLLTGLTRDGVYLVENGEVVGAVNNFRFNESPVAMLDRITEAGATQPTLPRELSDYFTRAAMPPLRVEGFNMSSVSQAS
jgi:predicted Zn-dependent protease